MEVLIGMLCGAVFFVGLILAHKAGQRAKKPAAKPDEELKRQAKEMQKHFQQLMNYDVNTAIKGKKVT